MGASSVWRRFLGWSRARVRPVGGVRARRGSGEDRGAGRLQDGADRALPARARLWPALMCAAARERVQGPGRGDRGTIAALFARTTPMERAARAVAA
jgi:hypothetical protein